MATVKLLSLNPTRALQFEGLERIRAPAPEEVLWIDVEGQTEAEMHELSRHFALHPLTVEDCLHLNQRPKYEEYSNYLFIVIHAFALAPEQDPGALDFVELHVFLGKGYLITVHTQGIEALKKLWLRLLGEPAIARRGADFLLYLLADAVVDSHFPLLDTLSDHLENIEEQAVGSANPETLHAIFRFKRALLLMRRVLSPERDALAALAKRGEPWITEKTAVYFRDVYDHLARICETIDTARELLGNALEAHLSMASNRTNEIMKRLTLLSAVFLPLTFVTGFFGQNFEHLPFRSDSLMFAMIASCVLIPSVMVLLFKRSGWF